MQWIAAAIILVALIYFVLQFAEFRRFVKWIGAAVMVVLVLVSAIFVAEYIDDEKKRELAKALIKLDEIEVSDAYLTLKNGLATVKGRVRNKSLYELSSFDLVIQIKDCRKVEDCDVVGEAIQSVYLSVPAGQVRQLDEVISFTGTPELRRMEWTYYVRETRALVK